MFLITPPNAPKEGVISWGLVMKRCPYCGKWVHDETINCRFCKRLIEPVSPTQQKSEGLWQKNGNLIAIIMIIAVVVIAYIYSKNINELKESKNISNQVLETNKKELENDVEQLTMNEYRRQQEEKAIKLQEEREKKEQQEDERQQQIYERQQQLEQPRLEREQQEYEAAQRRKQQQIEREIQEYELAQQRKDAGIRQKQQEAMGGQPRYVHKRFRRR